MTPEQLEQQIQDFAEHREFLRKPMSRIAIKQLRNRATRMLEAGVDIQEAFDRAILNGWQSIYAPAKQNKPASHVQTKLPDYGERTNPETARGNVRQLIQKARGG